MSFVFSRPGRDLRLDFFRGLALFLILISHTTDNPLTKFLPARFGFSDATEIFVFCSGLASALAFGGLMRKAGWLLMTARIVQRLWQVYWAHICLFLATLFTMLALDASGLFPRSQVSALNLLPFLETTAGNVMGLMTLTYVPNYFDILPMYLVFIAMIPLVLAVGMLSGIAALALCAMVWLGVTLTGFNLPAELWFSKPTQREWFFNPFAWQFLFFIGFGFGMGWIPAPPVSQKLVALALAVIIAALPFAWWGLAQHLPELRAWMNDHSALSAKTHFGVLRLIYFLALAYLAFVLCGPKGSRLQSANTGGLVEVIAHVGRQSLAIFMVAMVLSRVLGALLDLTDRGFSATLAVNLIGIGLLVLAAGIISWFGRAPWRNVKSATVLPAGETNRASARVSPSTAPPLRA